MFQVLHLLPDRDSEDERLGGLRDDGSLQTQQRQVHLPPQAVPATDAGPHVHQSQQDEQVTITLSPDTGSGTIKASSSEGHEIKPQSEFLFVFS